MSYRDLFLGLKAFDDHLVHVVFDELLRSEDRVADRAGLARAMADDAVPVRTHERGAAVLVVVVLGVEALHDRLEPKGEFGIDLEDFGGLMV